MDLLIIIIITSLLLVAYIFDLTSSKTRIPSVILLLLLGWLVRQLSMLFQFEIPDFQLALPILGTLGLILIVLEGSLELEMHQSKIPLIARSTIGSFISFLVMALILSWLFLFFGDFSLKTSLINAIPFCVISSAIAIPSVQNLSSERREFVIYESSFSDIVAVLVFNFIALNEDFGFVSFGSFGIQFVIIIAASFISMILLSVLLNKIDHHIKYFPIVLLFILIYSIAKAYHLPALIMVLLLGIFLGNVEELSHLKWLRFLKPKELVDEVLRFKELNYELTFFIRTLFFLMFGFMIETSELFNPDTALWALIIVVLIYGIRSLQLKLSGLPLFPLLFVAPRGLITILLFLSIPVSEQIYLVNKSLIIQVIVIGALIMMFGLITTGKKMPGQTGHSPDDEK